MRMACLNSALQYKPFECGVPQRPVFAPLLHCIMLFLKDLIHSTTSFITSLQLILKFTTNRNVSPELWCSISCDLSDISTQIPQTLCLERNSHLLRPAPSSNIRVPFIVLAVAHTQNSGVIFDSLSSLGPQSNQAANLIHSFLTVFLAAVPFHCRCHCAHLHPSQLTQDYYSSLINLTAS